jgi:RHS repeat-associated protein
LLTAAQHSRDSSTLGNTLTMTNNWGNDGRLAQRRLKTSTAVNRSLLTYTYDNDDNIIGITDAVTPANSITYAYDTRGRVSRVTAAATSTATYKREDLGYDANGNRTSVERRINATDAAAAQTDTYARTSGTNRLASLTSFAGTRSFIYDNRGNTASESRPSSISGTTTYDGHGRLTSYSDSGNASLSHIYNGLDDRIATTTTSGAASDTRRFVYDPDGRVIGEYGASAADLKAEFIWMSPSVGDEGDDGLGGYMPLAVATFGAGGSNILTLVHANHMGVPILYSSASGTPLQGQPADYAAPGFPGQSRTLADLYYNRYRDYDPSTGRYIQADPIGLAGGASPYSYAMSNPLRYGDPQGKNPAALLALLLAPEIVIPFAVIGGGILAYEWINHNPFLPPEYQGGLCFGGGTHGGGGVSNLGLGSGGATSENHNMNAPYVHGNSHQSPRPTEVYHLINKTTLEIDKIGITSLGKAGRYSQPWLDANNVEYTVIEQYQRRYPAVVHENIALMHYFFEHGELPKLNKTTN